MDKKLLLNRLEAACVRREYCVGQIEKKLSKYIFEGSISKEDSLWIINELISNRFVDDERFANAYVKDKYTIHGWGRKKIEYNLKNMGVASAIIAEAISVNINPDNSILDKILSRKWDSLSKEENIYKKREKLIRFALGRGFDCGEVLGYLNKKTAPSIT